MQLLLVTISIILLCFGFSFVFYWVKKAKEPRMGNVISRKQAPTKHKALVTCPLCSSLIGKGEKVKSVAFPSSNNERIMHISGCDHCLYGEKRRVCPVCLSSLSRDEILVARMFESDGKIRVKIFGCSKCGGKAAEL
jgi:C4-type Zn-finger protein